MATQENKLNNEAVLKMIRVSASLIKLGDRFFKKYDVTTAQYNVLTILDSSKSPVNQTELGTQLVVSRSDITGIVDRLEKLGYVKRGDSPTDRRVKFIALTEKGSLLIKKVEGAYFATVKHILRLLTQKEKNLLIEITNKIENSVGGGKDA